MILRTLDPQRRGNIYRTLLLAACLLTLTNSHADKDDQFLEFDDTMLEEELVYPEWFKLSFGDLRKDLEEALAAGKKGIVVYFGQKRCSYCEQFLEKDLGQPDIVSYMRRNFDVIPIDIWDIDDIIDTDGTEQSERELALKYQTNFTPSLVFYDENGKAVFLEYAWDMAWCDPCAADPLSSDELRRLGVFWLGDQRPIARGGAQNVFVTRLHLRYDREHFPEDLMFQETGDRQNYQGRYVIQHPWKGEARCDISSYQANVRERQEREAQQLANLTGWDIAEIRNKIPFAGGQRPVPEKEPWWKRLWN